MPEPRAKDRGAGAVNTGMPTADDIAAQLKQAEEQKKQAEELRNKQKEILRTEMADLDGQMAKMREQRARAAADLAKLG